MSKRISDCGSGMGRTQLQDGELWIYIKPVCRIVCGRHVTVVRVTPVSGVEGLGRNLVDVLRLLRILVED
jgi:hypothetical protein